MGLLTPYFVSGEGFLYTIIVPGGGFLLPSSRVPGVCPGGGMVLDEIDTCIRMHVLEFLSKLYALLCIFAENRGPKSRRVPDWTDIEVPSLVQPCGK